MVALSSLVMALMTMAKLYKPMQAEARQTALLDSLVKMKATAYTGGYITRDGSKPREGICASTPERLGLTVIVYKRNADGSIGEYIGTYEVKDTGGKGVAKGTVLDVYKPTYNDCVEFMKAVGDMNIYCQFIESEG